MIEYFILSLFDLNIAFIIHVVCGFLSYIVVDNVCHWYRGSLLHEKSTGSSLVIMMTFSAIIGSSIMILIMMFDVLVDGWYSDNHL